MSVIYDNRMPIMLSTGERYGIKINENGSGLILPVGFQNEDEARGFVSELQSISKKVQPSRWEKKALVVDGGRYAGAAYLKAGSSVELYPSWKYTWGSNDWRIINRIIRETSLGKKLIKYWMSKEPDLTKEVAQKRLEEIAPYF